MMNKTSRSALPALLLTIFLFAAGCQAAPVNHSQPTPFVPTPDLAPTENLQASTATVAATAAPCLESKGTMKTDKIETQLLNWPLEFTVYLPPCYSKSNQQPYPVLYMLHGMANDLNQWPRLGLIDAADELISTGEIIPMIIVMPYEVSWSAGPEQSKYGETLTSDLLPYIEDTYNACREKECRMIGGLSRGGNWAVNLGFTHPELFSAVGSHSAPLFFGEMNRITSILQSSKTSKKLPSFYVDAGHKDENLSQVLAFVALLKDYDIPYIYTQFTGYHTEDYWRAHVADYLKWYSNQVSLYP